MSINARKIWEEVKANSAKLNSCKIHKFSGPATIGRRKICESCGGELSLTDILSYVKGYQAAGGNAADVWPEWVKGKE